MVIFLSQGGEKHIVKRGWVKLFLIDLLDEQSDREFTTKELLEEFERRNGIILRQSTLRRNINVLYKRGFLNKEKHLNSPYLHIKKNKQIDNSEKKVFYGEVEAFLIELLNEQPDRSFTTRDIRFEFEKKNGIKLINDTLLLNINKLYEKGFLSREKYSKSSLLHIKKIGNMRDKEEKPVESEGIQKEVISEDCNKYNSNIMEKLEKKQEQIFILKKKLRKFKDQEKKRKGKENCMNYDDLLNIIERQRTKIAIQDIKLKDLQEKLEISCEKKLDGLWICPEKHYIFEREKLLVDTQEYFICKKCKCAYRWNKWKFYPITKGEFEKEIVKLIPKLSSLVDLELIDLNKIPLQINL